MQQYDSYKDSGVQWLGEIPSHWEIKPGRTIFSENKMKNTALAEEVVLSLSYGKIIEKQNKNDGLVPEEYSSYQIIEPGFIIVRCTDLQNDHVSLRTAISELHGIITSAYLALIPNNSICPKYFHYFFRNWDNTKELYRYGSGLRQSLSWNDFKYLLCVLPPLSEQSAIAAYLDEQTARIDTAIAQQQKMIDLLNERKQIIINRAVTKGLNPNAKMKDSGVEWIGEVPEHWDAVRIKYLLNEKKERSQTGSEEPLSMSQKHGLIPTKDMDIVPNMASSFVGAKIVNKGNLVFNKLKAHLGVFATSEYEGLVSPDYAVYEGTGLADLKFLEYIFKTPKCIAEFVKLITGVGAGLSRLYTGDLYSIYIPLPPCQEQTNIVEHIEASTRNIKTAINNAEQQIALLQERKQIIINDVVTGKVKII